MELKIENLVKCYGKKTAVKNLDMVLTEGIYGLLGENGAGKTTLMELLCGIQQPTQGTIRFNGKEIGRMGEDYRKLLGYLPQRFGYYPDFKVEDFMLYMAALKGLSDRKAMEKTEELLEAVGLSGESTHKIKTLSGGMGQRLGIAQAMLNDPGILILDEPTVGLDPGERRRFRHLIRDFSKDRIVLLSTHIVSDIEALAENVIIMRSGRMIYFEKVVSNLEDVYFQCVKEGER